MIRPLKFRERLALAIAVVQALIISFQSVPYSVYAANNRFANLILIYHENLRCDFQIYFLYGKLTAFILQIPISGYEYHTDVYWSLVNQLDLQPDNRLRIW